MPFRTKLVYFGLTLIAIVALPILYFEIQRPWQKLYGLVDRTEALLSGLTPSFDKEELRQMNQFALEMIDVLYDGIKEEHPDDYYPDWAPSQAFNLLLIEEKLLTKKEVASQFEEEDLQYSEFSYEELEKWYQFWQEELNKRPGLLLIFKKYKKILMEAHDNAGASGFDIADIYVMLDTGQANSGFFKENIAFVLESLPWWESCYSGEPYNLVETDTENWRASYDHKLGGRPGFHHNPVFDPERWYLPRFDKDKWGTWFTSWVARESHSKRGEVIYNSFNIDFEAGKVTNLMMKVGLAVIVITILLLSIVIFTSHRLGLMLIRPIEALIKGAEAVMAKNYDHVVPIFGKDEFKRLSEVFNEMIKRVREMVNLKETLTKLLCEELAEKAATGGLVLGGQNVCCTILFTDFAGFSTLTRKMNAEEVVKLLNFYFGELIPIIKKWGGFPDKFIGDGIIAIFGAPVRFEDHAKQAVRCAIEMQRRLRTINNERIQKENIVFEMRIGLNTGDVVAGFIGCDLKLEYTSIGETTNLANRMEAKCEIGHVLMSKDTFDQIKDITFEEVSISQTPEKEIVKGYLEPVSTYGIRVQDLKIEKNLSTSDPSNFYIYQTHSTA